MMQDKEAYADGNGVRYRKHGVRSRLFGYSYRDAYYPIAEDDPKRVLYVTLFLGIFGGHKFMAGEYGKGILYLLTCGGFGVFYVCDVLNILTENYCITQVNYSEEPDGSLARRKLKLYLDKVKMSAPGRVAVLAAAVLIGAGSMRLGYTRFLLWVDHGIERAVSSYMTDYGKDTEFVNWEELSLEVTKK